MDEKGIFVLQIVKLWFTQIEICKLPYIYIQSTIYTIIIYAFAQ